MLAFHDDVIISFAYIAIIPRIRFLIGPVKTKFDRIRLL